jgi:hypothetical protein
MPMGTGSVGSCLGLPAKRQDHGRSGERTEGDSKYVQSIGHRSNTTEGNFAEFLNFKDKFISIFTADSEII